MAKEKRARTLTKAELRRKAEFEAKTTELESLGYKASPLTIDVVYANVMAIVVTLPFLLPLCVLFFGLQGFSGISVSLSGSSFVVSLVVILALIVIHELIHGFFWGLFAEHGFKAVEFGVIWKYATPYCTCRDALKKSHYIIGAMMPLVLLGVLPAIIASINGSGTLFTISLFMTMAGGGDVLIALKLLRYHPAGKQVVYLDHPYECGLVAFEK